MPATFFVSPKTGNGLDIQGFSDQIVTKVQMQIPVSAISFDGDRFYNFRHDNSFIWGRPVSRPWPKSRRITQFAG
jgi:hypothetical protein